MSNGNGTAVSAPKVVVGTPPANAQATAGDAELVGKIVNAIVKADAAHRKAERDLYNRMGPTDTFGDVSDTDIEKLGELYNEATQTALAGRIELAKVPLNTRHRGATMQDVFIFCFGNNVDRDGGSRTPAGEAVKRVKTAYVS